MSTNQSDEIVARLKLDIRALTLLYDADSDLRPVVERQFVESQDSYVMRFLSLLQARKAPEEGGSLPIALGEIVLACFLTILGLATFVPVMAGVSTPQQWLSYFAGALSSTLTSGPIYRGLPLLDFAFAAALLLGAFYSLRRAARNLKSAGLIIEPGRR